MRHSVATSNVGALVGKGARRLRASLRAATLAAAVPLAFAALPAVKAAESTALKVTILSMAFPPILHATPTGAFSGTMGESVKALCENGGLDCDFEIVPLSRAYTMLREGSADALITINVQQLNGCCTPSDWQSPWTAGFFSNRGQATIPQAPAELDGRSLIVVLGMKSPYQFATDLDAMADKGRLTLYRAPHILSSVKMFLADRADLLWGGEDFKWYIEKLSPGFHYAFKPLVQKNVVVWVRKDRPEVLSRLNWGLIKLQSQHALAPNNLLVPAIMHTRYVDAALAQKE